MAVALCILKVGLFCVVLLFIGTNLAGFVIEGLIKILRGPRLRRQYGDSPILQAEVVRYGRVNVGVTIFFSLLTVVYLIFLARMWNLGVAAAGAAFFLTRVPDLLYPAPPVEGQLKPTYNPPRSLAVMAVVVDWLMVPVLWFSLCWHR